jgi:hypothetical protein
VNSSPLVTFRIALIYSTPMQCHHRERINLIITHSEGLNFSFILCSSHHHNK